MSVPRPVTTLWSEEQLDSALAELHAGRPVNTAALPRARSALLAAASAAGLSDPVTSEYQASSSESDSNVGVAERHPSSARHSWRRRAGAVLIAAALVAVALLLPSLVTQNGRPVASADASRALTQAAAAVGASDPVVAPGQYKYLQTHAWWAGIDGNTVRLIENQETVWVPADPSDPAAMWMLQRGPTGQVQWISGDPSDASGLSDPMDIYPTMNVQAACGDFYGSGGCDRIGSWQDPTPAFLLALPRDPTALLERLRTDAPNNGRGDIELLVYAADLLRSGLVPADLRAALYRALATLPDIDMVDRAVTLDGQAGVALGMQDGQIRQDIIIDAATGAFIGEREVALENLDEIPAGAVMSSTSLTTAVVDTLGGTP